MSLLNKYVIAFNLPVFPEDKKARFLKFFCNVLNKTDPNITQDNINIPMKDGKSQGFAFIECKDNTSAKNLIIAGDFSPIDKTTSARLISPDQFTKYINGDNKPKPLVIEKAQTNKKQSFSWYLVDERLFDQIVYSASKIPHAAWFNHTNASLEEIDLPSYINNCNDFFFSPDGSFFGLQNDNKIYTFCGESWIPFSVIEFPPKGTLHYYGYSPSGRYMLLCGRTDCLKDNPYRPVGAAVYDMLTSSQLLRLCVDQEYSSNVDFGAGDILFFQTKEMRFYYPPDYSAKNSKSINQVFDHFDSSKVTKILFTFRKEVGSSPPRIQFYSTETAEVIYNSVLYNATDAYCIWHPSLAVCAVVVTISVRNKERSYLSVYDLRNPGNVLNFSAQDVKGNILNCAWDPKPTSGELTLSLILDNNGAKQIRVLQVKTNLNQVAAFPTGVSNIQYSPSGRFAIADDIDNNTSMVQFFDMDSGLILSKEIDGVSDIQWDPSGVFVMISSSQKSSSGEFSIYLLDGNKVLTKKQQGFGKCIWRPRIVILDDKDYDAVKNIVDESFKKYGRFGAIDSKLLEEEKKQTRIKQMKKWLEFQDKTRSYEAKSSDSGKSEFRIKYNMESEE